MAEYIERDELLRYCERMAELALSKLKGVPKDNLWYQIFTTQREERLEFGSLLRNAPAICCKNCVSWDKGNYDSCNGEYVGKCYTINSVCDESFFCGHFQRLDGDSNGG